MDTDFLRDETYKGVIAEAEKFSHSLAVEFGFLASLCKDEDEFLSEALSLIEGFQNFDSEDYREVFPDSSADIHSFISALNRITENIARIDSRDKRVCPPRL